MARTRQRQPDKIKKVVELVELPTPGHSFVHIPELKIRVKLKKGDTLQHWVKAYCRSNTHLKSILYPIYNVKV